MRRARWVQLSRVREWSAVKKSDTRWLAHIRTAPRIVASLAVLRTEVACSPRAVGGTRHRRAHTRTTVTTSGNLDAATLPMAVACIAWRIVER